MAQSIPNSSIPHLLPPPPRPPCPTCSCPLSHVQQPPVPSTVTPSASPSSGNKKMKLGQDTITQPPGSSISAPNPGSTLNFPGPKHPQAFSFPRSRLHEVLHFPQPQLPASSVAPTPISTAAPPPNQVSTAAPTPPAAASSPPPLVPSQANAVDLPSSNPTSLVGSFIYKNKLQEYTQRSSISLPEYRTVNEGSQHAPRFRSSVTVNGVVYTSPNTFSNRKAAEQDIAKLVMEHVPKKINKGWSSLICGDTVFCKSILNEFAVKMNLPKPTYDIVQPQAVIPVFVSSLVFNGITYTGDPGKNKKEADQLAARAAILSLMGDSGFGTALSEIINSKGKLFDAFSKVKDLNYAHISVVPKGINAGSDFEIPQTQDQVVQAYVLAPNQSISTTQEVSMPASSQPISVVQEVAVPAPSQPISVIASVPIASPSIKEASVSTVNEPIKAMTSVPIVSQSIGATKGASVPSVNQQISAIQGASVSAMGQPMSVVPEAYTHPSYQEWRVPKPETLSAANNPSNVFEPPIQQPFILSVPSAPAQQPFILSVPPASAQQQSLGVVPNIGKKRHPRKNKKANKKVQVAMQ